MRASRLAVAAVLLLGGLPPTAGAAPTKPAPVCQQVTDAEADTVFEPVGAPSLDVLSGDIATGRKNLVLALRMKTLDRDAFLVGGITYLWAWRAGDRYQQVLYYTYATGETLAHFDPNTAGPPGDEVAVGAVADQTTSTITWTVPRKVVPALRKPGAKFTGFALRAFAAQNLRVAGDSRGWAGQLGDLATSTGTYRDRTPTCLKGT